MEVDLKFAENLQCLEFLSNALKEIKHKSKKIRQFYFFRFIRAESQFEYHSCFCGWYRNWVEKD